MCAKLQNYQPKGYINTFTVKSVYNNYAQFLCSVTWMHGHNAQSQCTVTMHSHNAQIQCTVTIHGQKVEMHNSYFSSMHTLVF